MSQEPEFRAWHRQVNRRAAVFCAVAIPVGFFFIRTAPQVTLIVSGLGGLGLVISLWRLQTLPR
jgi:hypothetical protein